MSGLSLQYILRAAVASMVRGHHEPHCYSAHVPGKGYVNEGNDETTRADYLRQLEQSAKSEAENARWSPRYSEPGYNDPERGVVLCNWNVFPRGLDTILEHAGFEIQWADEWAECDECMKLVRTSANSYGWRKSYVMPDDCSIVCRDCYDPESYVNDVLLNNEDAADTLDTDLAALGFTKFNEDSYENGWHPGQNDTPAEVVKHLPQGVDFVFQVPSVGQFDVRFDVWIRPQETEE